VDASTIFALSIMALAWAFQYLHHYQDVEIPFVYLTLTIARSPQAFLIHCRYGSANTTIGVRVDRQQQLM
jgi:hypothetical protein